MNLKDLQLIIDKIVEKDPLYHKVTINLDEEKKLYFIKVTKYCTKCKPIISVGFKQHLINENNAEEILKRQMKTIYEYIDMKLTAKIKEIKQRGKNNDELI